MHQQQMADIVSQDNSIAKHRFVMVEDSSVHNVTVEDDSCSSISFGVRAAVECMHKRRFRDEIRNI